MAFLTNLEQAPALDLQPIIVKVKVGDAPIEKVISDGETVIAFMGGQAFALGAYHLDEPRMIDPADIPHLIGRQRPPSYLGTTSVSKQDGKLHYSLELKKRNRIRSKMFYATRTPPENGNPATTSFCTNREGTFLSWGMPETIQINELLTRQRQIIAQIPVPGILPTSMASTPGLLIVGTANGEVFSLSFQPKVVHFILSLENEVRLSGK